MNHHQIYNAIPSFQCEKGCTACCGPMQKFDDWELKQLDELKFPDSNRCPYLTKKGCEIYDKRPFICRLYGSMETLRCPKGYGPEKLLTHEEGNKLISQYHLLE